MKRPSRLDYAYAVGRVRVLERHLVSRPVFREAAEEKDLAGVLKMIFDAGKFHEERIDIKESEELDAFLDREEESLMRTVSEIMLENNILGVVRSENQPEQALALTKNIGYPFIRDYVRHRIDLGNLKMLVRMKYLDFPEEKYAKAVLKGGFLEERLFLESYNTSFAEIADRLYPTPYQDVWNKATEALLARETFIELERGFEDFLMRYLRKARQIVFGPEPVFAYALARKREINLTRILGVGKLNGLPPAIIKKRISETYV